MTWARIAWARIVPIALVTTIASCDALSVSDPTAIEESDVANAAGADLLRKDAVSRLYYAVSEAVATTGVLADEFHYWRFREDLDARQILPDEQSAGSAAYTLWQQARSAATLAMPALRAHGASQAHIGEMFAVRAMATLGLAESFCPGFPLHDLQGFTPVYGPPLSTDEAFQRALADLDSALVYANDSTRILNIARVARARVLVGLGRFPEAALEANAIPTSYEWNAEYSSSSSQVNLIGFDAEPNSSKDRSVADFEGGRGLNFITADDPRVSTTAVTTSEGTAYLFTKYPNRSAPIRMASGIEARLIQAEAAVNANDPSWLPILNGLRTDGSQTAGVWNPGSGGVPGLAPLSDPGNAEARVDLLFRERAFWLFATAHRLGDLRRLMSRYGRQADTVFPTGIHPRGGTFGTATSLRFPAHLERAHNAAVTGCTSP